MRSLKKTKSDIAPVDQEELAELAADKSDGRTEKALGSDFQPLSERCEHYLSLKARVAIERARFSKIQKEKQAAKSGEKLAAGNGSSPSTHGEDTPGKGPRLRPSESGVADAADEFLHDDCCPEDTSTSMVISDYQGKLTLLRPVASEMRCLEISFLDRVDPMWRIPLRDVVNIRNWLNRQYLTAQQRSTKPPINPRATTQLEDLWEILAQFDTNTSSQAVIIRAVPLEAPSQKLVIHARIIADTPLRDRTASDRQSATDRLEQIRLRLQLRAQEAQNEQLKTSLATTTETLGRAKLLIYLLQGRNESLQDQKPFTKSKMVTVLEATDKEPEEDFLEVEPDSVQQATDLTDDIYTAACRLVDVVENYVIIRNGYTKRTLADLQVVQDTIESTVKAIVDEPLPEWKRGREGPASTNNTSASTKCARDIAEEEAEVDTEDEGIASPGEDVAEAEAMDGTTKQISSTEEGQD